MHFSLVQLATFLGLASLAVSVPLTKRDHYDCGQLSQQPPPSGKGQGNFGDYSNFNLQVNDINILQFALMLEVFPFPIIV